MRDRRALTVRFGAAAGVAAMAVGLVIPAPRLLAQKPDDGPGAKAPAEPQIPESPPGLPDAKTTTSPAPALPDHDPNPLPPALPTPSAASDPKATTTTAWTPGGTFADPEGAAKAFVERSQKEADEAINALAKEAETLRARLEKVEAGLARWQAVKESLGSSAAARPGWRPRGGDPPTILEPASPAGEPKARPSIPAGSPAETEKPPGSTAPADPAAGAPQPKGVVHVPPTSRRGE
jgi:hypothetical protein